MDTNKIAGLNDSFRHSGSSVFMTRGVQALDGLLGLLDVIKRFDAFTEGNDPYGEHDFGAIVWMGNKVFWKIDYYDQTLQYGEDPLSPKCERRLTVMLASEY